MTVEKSLIQLILDLLKDPAKLAEFKHDPQGMLASCGLSNVSAEDIRDALVIAQDNDQVSFDRHYDTGVKWDGGHGGHGGHHHPVEHPKPGEDPVKYLDKYVTNNHYTYNIDDRDTNIDNSVNQNIDTGGGDFKQSIDNHSVNSTGDGSVAAGGDIKDSNVATGDHSVAGNGNQVVNGHDDTSAFGNGSANKVGDISADHGSAVSVGGNASGSHDATDSFNHTHNESHQSTDISDSYDTDSSSHNAVHTDDHSHTHTDVLSHNSVDLTLGA